MYLYCGRELSKKKKKVYLALRMVISQLIPDHDTTNTLVKVSFFPQESQRSKNINYITNI